MKLLYHLLFPNEENNFRAKLLHPSFLFFLKLFLISFQISLQIFRFIPQPRILGYAANISPQEIIRLTNEERAKNGLSPLVENPVLSQAAIAKGLDMIERDYWAHVAPDGTEPWLFFLRFGYNYRFAGENLARDFSNAASVVSAWMASASHRENILSPKYNEIGVGVVEGELNGVQTTLIVQFFGNRGTQRKEVSKVSVSAKSERKSLVLPSPSPSFSPSPSPSPVLTKEQVLDKEKFVLEKSEEASEEPKILISPFLVTKNLSLVIVLIIIFVMIVDAVIITRKRVKRIGGRILAHIAFLTAIIILVLLLRAGQII